MLQSMQPSMYPNKLQIHVRLFSMLILFLTLGYRLDLHTPTSFHGNSEARPVAMSETGYEARAEADPGITPETEFKSTLGIVEANVTLPDQPHSLSYKIQEGDTLDQISESQIEDPYLLAAGEQLAIPAEDAIQLPDGQNKVIKQVMTSTLTAYTAGEESTGKTKTHASYGITYSGSKAEEGRTIAVDPAIIPIGTDVFIDGIGLRTAEDTGSAIRGTKIDVFMEDLEQAVHFGVKHNVKVYVLSTDNVTE